MCAALTENVVLVRTRSHDLASVKKLNCWGCALKDVSIVHRMPNVEVISLSINSIDTLENFASCTMLQELYLRKNEIKNINEILHLSQLQFLKKLSLEDNPCTTTDNYRLTVLKALPNLEFLDNVRVTPEEIYQAEKSGRDLVWPGSEADIPEDEMPEEMPEEVEYTTSAHSNHHQHPSHHDSQSSLSNGTAQSNGYTAAAAAAHESSQYCASVSEEAASSSPSGSSSYQGGINQTGTTNRSSASHLNNSNNSNSSSNNNNRDGYSNGGSGNKSGSKTNMAKSNSLSDYNLYHNGNYRSNSPPPLSATNNYEPSEYSYDNGHSNGQAQPFSTPTYHQNGSTRNIQSSASSQPRLLPKGGKNRNANILSAVLCLIKELDYGSLEVVDTTIHCRMEEMED